MESFFFREQRCDGWRQNRDGGRHDGRDKKIKNLRKGNSFGQVFTHEINPGTAIFVPKGVANGYQTLDDNIAYTYLVDAHWSPDAKYTFVNLFDPALSIDWPISQDQAIISEKDAAHPLLENVTPMED